MNLSKFMCHSNCVPSEHYSHHKYYKDQEGNFYNLESVIFFKMNYSYLISGTGFQLIKPIPTTQQ